MGQSTRSKIKCFACATVLVLFLVFVFFSVLFYAWKEKNHCLYSWSSIGTLGGWCNRWELFVVVLFLVFLVFFLVILVILVFLFFHQCKCSWLRRSARCIERCYSFHDKNLSMPPLSKYATVRWSFWFMVSYETGTQQRCTGTGYTSTKTKARPWSWSF